MATSLENQYIDESYQKLVQLSGSVIADGTGSAITSLNITASHAQNVTSASYAVTASYALNVTPHESASYAVSASHAENADNAGVAYIATSSISASRATSAASADTSTSASYAATASILLGSVESASFASTATSASFATNALTASFLLGGIESASYATFAQTASIATSASHAIQADSSLTADSATSSSYASTATSASHAINSDLAITASYAKSVDAIGVTGSVENATYAQNTVTTGKNLSGGLIAKGTPLYFTGSNTSGNIVGIYPADAGNPNRMPAGGVAGVDIASGAEGVVLLDGFINGVNTTAFASGDKIYVGVGGGYTNVEPTGSSNLVQFLGNVEKSDSNGSGVIQMMGEARRLPNIATNNVWLGDANGVPQAVNQNTLSVASAVTANTASYVAGANVDGTVANATSASHALQADSSLASDTATSASHAVQADSALSATTATSSSHAVNADTASFLPSTTRLNITDITASNATFTSASIGYLQTITGSAKIIGDAFIILNNDTPTERYAGVKVIDSGSNNTSSLQFDGQTNDWFYEYEGDDPTNYGAVMFGPEYGTKGSPSYPSANTILKGNGNHHITDSNLQDDGSKISSTLPFSSSAGFTGSLHGNADTATSATSANSVAFANITGKPTLVSGSSQIDLSQATGIAANATSASHAVQADSSLTSNTATTASYVAAANVHGTVANATSASHAVQADSSLTADSATTASYVLASNVDGTVANATSSSYAITASFAENAGQSEGVNTSGDLKFENSIAEVYGSEASPLSSATLTFSTTSTPIVGASAVVFHSSSAEPTIATGSYSISKKAGLYDAQQLNIITFVYLGNNDFLQTIIGTTSGNVTNVTDTYDTTPRVDHIVTLTQAQYNSISASADINTLYVTI